jgi:hypothetical protein
MTSDTEAAPKPTSAELSSGELCSGELLDPAEEMAAGRC